VSEAARPRAVRSPVIERKYGEIVEAAGRLFAQQGFDGTSLQDIANEVGVLKGSLYHYITSKEDLLADVVQLGQQGLQENITLCNNFTGSPIDQVIAFTYGHVCLNATPERIERASVFFHDWEKVKPDRRRDLVKDRDDYERYLRDVLTAGREDGSIDPDVNIRNCSFAILGVITSYNRWYRPGGPLTPDQLGREFAAFSLAAVRTPATGASHSRFGRVDEIVVRCREIIASSKTEVSYPRRPRAIMGRQLTEY
jgi:AcrR family transcriptional regulator